MICTRCEGTGFLNLHQLPDEIRDCDSIVVLDWIDSHRDETDAQVCDCCGDGDGWHGEPGHHYGADDPPGPRGPYAYNGGLCECN